MPAIRITIKRGHETLFVTTANSRLSVDQAAAIEAAINCNTALRCHVDCLPAMARYVFRDEKTGRERSQLGQSEHQAKALLELALATDADHRPKLVCIEVYAEGEPRYDKVPDLRSDADGCAKHATGVAECTCGKADRESAEETRKHVEALAHVLGEEADERWDGLA